MFEHNINPVLFGLGSLEIRYYGLAYVLGFLIVTYITIRIAEKKQIKGIYKETVLDLMTYILIGLLVGARIFYVLIVHPSFYFSNPFEIIAVWHGGMLFHGGLVGAVASALYFCKKRNIRFYDIADIVVVPVGLALMLGRIANFINGEIVGKISSVPWAVKFPDYEGYRHPSQIYEAIKNLLIFTVMFHLDKKNFKSGTMFWSFVGLYSLLRLMVEFLKTSDRTLFGMNFIQYASLVLLISAIFMLKKINNK